MPPSSVSVVIRTFNSAKTLPEVLARLDLEAGDELICVDSESSDGTVEIATERGATILRMSLAEFTYGRKLNLGFRRAVHDWVLVLSSHCVPAEDNLLRTYRRAMARFDERVVAAVGPHLRSDLDRHLATGITLYDREDFKRGFGFGGGNPNCLYRRSAWLLHPFDEQLNGGEDYEWYTWAVREGYHLAAVHAAAVRYAPVHSWRRSLERGRLDYEVVSRFVEIDPPSLATAASHSSKLLLYWILRRLSWSGARGSFLHYLGWYLESKKFSKRRGTHGHHP